MDLNDEEIYVIEVEAKVKGDPIMLMKPISGPLKSWHTTGGPIVDEKFMLEKLGFNPPPAL